MAGETVAGADSARRKRLCKFPRFLTFPFLPVFFPFFPSPLLLVHSISLFDLSVAQPPIPFVSSEIKYTGA